MKKVFISVALACALAFGASAQSIPGWYSYQGVSTEKSQEIKVDLYITPLDESENLYIETHTVTTNAAGAFSVQLGLGTPTENSLYANIEDIDWAAGPYKVVTWINGNVVGEAQLGAVPYATIAGKALGVAGVENIGEEFEALWQKNEDQDVFVTTLVNRVEANTEAIDMYAEGLIEQIEQVATGLTQLNNGVLALEEEVGINANGLAEAEKSIQEISEAMPGMGAAINGLREDVDLNITGLAEAEKSIQELSEAMPGLSAQVNKLLEDNDINIDAIANAEQSIMELTEANKENKAAIGILEAKVATLSGDADVDLASIKEDIAALKDQVIYATEQADNANLMGTQLSNVVTDLAAEVEINSNGLAEAEKSIMEMSEVLPGLGAAVESLKAEVEINSNGLAEAEKSIMEMSEVLPGLGAAVESIKAEVEINSNGLAEAEKSIMEMSEVLPGLGAAVESLKAEVEININGLAEAEQAISELSPAVAGNTGAIAALQVEVETNTNGLAEAEKSIMEMSEVLPGLGAAVESLKAEVEINSNGLAEAEQSISEISEAIPGLTGQVNKLNQEMEGAYEQLESIATLATGASQIAMANEEAIAEMKDQLVYAVEQADNANQAITNINNIVLDLSADHDDVWAEIARIKDLLTTQGMAIADLQALINGLVK